MRFMIKDGQFCLKMTPTTSGYGYNNTTAEVFEPCNRDDDNSLGAYMSILYYLMFVFSVFTNVSVLVVLCRSEKLSTVVNILLVNLVVSSMIFMSSLPFVAVYMQLSYWIFGLVMCKIVFSVHFLGFYSSAFFLTLLMMDRYFAIVHSMSALQRRSRCYAIISCTVVWLISGLACIRPMLLRNTYSHMEIVYCENTLNLTNVDGTMLQKSEFYVRIFVFLILPLVVNSYCSVRIIITIRSSKSAKLKAVRVISVIVVLFFICWIPFNIVELLHDGPKDCREEQRLGYALQITRNMAYFYFCISPIFYTFVGKKFQKQFKKLLKKHLLCLKKYISYNLDNNTSGFTAGTEHSSTK
ncbi:C-C chemokine receptor type 3-like [Fundulus heteroclitus]|uniref:C-C chemokine receptor type 3-like n=1 Tax=Fundulus heteroclitus TaxID=8078 RepID=UPI00165AB729|nr:C-C chemokine receptor type 3-like [Fundulus heteroclitus]